MYGAPLQSELIANAGADSERAKGAAPANYYGLYGCV